MAAIWTRTVVSEVHPQGLFDTKAGESGDSSPEERSRRDKMASLWQSPPRKPREVPEDSFPSGPPELSWSEKDDVFTTFRTLADDQLTPASDPFARWAPEPPASPLHPFATRPDRPEEAERSSRPFGGRMEPNDEPLRGTHGFATRADELEPAGAAHPFGAPKKGDLEADMGSTARPIKGAVPSSEGAEPPSETASHERLHKGRPPVLGAGEPHFEEAIAAIRAKDYERAHLALEAALELEPDNRLYQANLSRVKDRLAADPEKKAQSPW